MELGLNDSEKYLFEFTHHKWRVEWLGARTRFSVVRCQEIIVWAILRPWGTDFTKQICIINLLPRSERVAIVTRDNLLPRSERVATLTRDSLLPRSERVAIVTRDNLLPRSERVATVTRDNLLPRSERVATVTRDNLLPRCERVATVTRDNHLSVYRNNCCFFWEPFNERTNKHTQTPCWHQNASS
jgi:hypothetical protein